MKISKQTGPKHYIEKSRGWIDITHIEGFKMVRLNTLTGNVKEDNSSSNQNIQFEL